MNKTTKRTLLAAALIATGLNANVLAVEKSPSRPNILWLLAEDFSPHLGCYGDPDAKTPAIDRLASEGVRFTRAFSHASVCAPARATLHFGISPVTTGLHQMRTLIDLPKNMKPFTELLREGGYYCFNGMALEGPFAVGIQAKNDINSAVRPGMWDAECDTWDGKLKSPEAARRATWRARADGQPFFGLIGFLATHQSQYGRGKDPTWGLNLIPLVKPADFIDRATVRFPPYYPDTPEVREIWGRYKDTATQVDRQVARIIEKLKADGLYDDTIIIFFGDHGHGIPGGKRVLWDSGLLVPLIVRVPGKYQHLMAKRPGSIEDRLVSFEDFAPTMLGLAGMTSPEAMQGQRFMGVGSEKKRKYAYGIRNRIDGNYELIRTVRDERYHYVRNFLPHIGWRAQFSEKDWAPYLFQGLKREHNKGTLTPRQDVFFTDHRPVEELYDMENDPFQLTNIADKPENRETLGRLRKTCFQHMLETRDLGLIPEIECRRQSEGSTAYDVAMNRKSELNAKLVNAAFTASERKAANLPALQALLDEDDAALRWWGAVGLRALGQQAAPAKEALLARLADPAIEVRLMAAEAWWILGDEKVARPVFETALQDPSMFVRMRAVDGLVNLGTLAQPMIPAVRAAAIPKTHHPIASYHLNSLINEFLDNFGKEHIEWW